LIRQRFVKLACQTSDGKILNGDSHLERKTVTYGHLVTSLKAAANAIQFMGISQVLSAHLPPCAQTIARLQESALLL
jgi:hypothetical protein